MFEGKYIINENERRNLFTYATKELSQDAFLMWLFNNYDDEEVAPVAYALLREFCGLTPDEKITKLCTQPQWHKIDISVWFKTDRGKEYALFIEDKTDSAEHNQLVRYNESIKQLEGKGYEIHKVYYKPGYLYPKERERVVAAKWEGPYSAKEIYELLRNYETSGNPIVRQYIEHIKSREVALSMTERPTKSSAKEDFLQWFAFFDNVVIPKLEEWFGEEKGSFGSWKGQYPYVTLSVHYHGMEHIPYLEIRSKDCLNGYFISKVLCHGVSDEPRKQALIKRIDSQGFFSQKNVRKNDPQQVGWKAEGNIDTAAAFVEAAKRSVEAYLDLMNDWN